ncbi:MAG: laccase domain-containing protein, partial [Saprospiraceae bacterium]|nr:laccase domain-containing protein [Saprospiraceae bacterium]
GWRGTVARIVAKTLAEMSATFGTDPRDCLAYVGTCIDECEFEVGPEVAEQFDPAFVRWDELRAKHFVDLKAANRAQLLDAGLPALQIEVSPYCTVQHNADYFSYRAEQGRTGRMLALIGWRKNRKA